MGRPGWWGGRLAASRLGSHAGLSACRRDLHFDVDGVCKLVCGWALGWEAAPSPSSPLLCWPPSRQSPPRFPAACRTLPTAPPAHPPAPLPRAGPGRRGARAPGFSPGRPSARASGAGFAPMEERPGMPEVAARAMHVQGSKGAAPAAGASRKGASRARRRREGCPHDGRVPGRRTSRPHHATAIHLRGGGAQQLFHRWLAQPAVASGAAAVWRKQQSRRVAQAAEPGGVGARTPGSAQLARRCIDERGQTCRHMWA